MTVRIIGQGYDPSKNSSVAKELIGLFKEQKYNSFIAVSAFASETAIYGLEKYITNAKNNGWDITFIVGIDQKGTSKQALEAILSLNVNGYILHNNYSGGTITFHPKFYYFKGNAEYAIIIGSNNLTTNGLGRNPECATLIKGRIGDVVYRQFEEYWGELVSCNDSSLKQINPTLISDLDLDGYLPSEEERMRRHDCSNKAHNSGAPHVVFNDGILSRLPDGFTPHKRERADVLATPNNAAAHNQNNTPTITQSSSTDYKLLITEMVNNNVRWSQANVKKDNFIDFFGYNNQAFPFYMKNINEDGTEGVESEVSHVIVQSNNYRIETNCPETKGPYPVNEERPIAVYLRIDRTHFEFCVLRENHRLYKQLKAFLDTISTSSQREVKRAYSSLTELRDAIPDFPLALAHKQ